MEPVRASIPLPLRQPSLRHDSIRPADGASCEWFPPGHVVVREGETPASLFVVEVGAVAISCTAPSGRMGTLAVLGPGDAFGIEGLARANPPGAGRLRTGEPALLPEARTLVRSRILCAPVSGLRPALEQVSQIARWLAAAALRLQEQERLLLRALTLTVPDAVHSALADLARRHGQAVPGGLLIDLPVSQESLARMVGATRESVNRALQGLAAAGLVGRSGRRYVVRTQCDEAVSSK